jgi:hypothetical protein
VIAWRPHTDIPIAPTVAVICILVEGDHRDMHPILLPELYRWDVRLGAWISENGGLLLRARTFRWLKETDILETLP